MANMFELKKREKRGNMSKSKTDVLGVLRVQKSMFLFINYADLFCPSSPSLSSLGSFSINDENGNDNAIN